MSAPATIDHSQKGAFSYDAHPDRLHIRADSLSARRRVSPLAILLPVNRGTRHLLRGLRRSNGSRPHAIAHQHPIKFIAAALIHLRCLSSISSSAGSNNASNRRQGLGNSLQHRGFFIQGAGRHD